MMSHPAGLRSVRIIALSLLALGCGPSIPIRFPQFPEQTGAQLRTVTEGKRNVGIVAAEGSRDGFMSDGGGWTATMEAALSNEITGRGYYDVVDISARKERLRELAYTQSGMTAESLQIGRELAVNLLLIVRPTQRPRAECRIEKRTDYAASLASMAQAAAQGNSGQQQGLQKKDTGVLSLTVFVQGVLVNVETGRSLSYGNSQPFQLAADVGDPNCPSQLQAFDGALQLAAQNIASRLSPTVVTVNVPLLADTEELGPNGARVQGWLESGNQWAESENFEEAAKSWQRALNESDGESVSALWNLAVYSWYSGDYDRAEEYFDKALDGAGPSWLDGAKRQLISKFREQKNLERGRPPR